MKRILRLTLNRADERRDVERELQLHLALRVEELIAGGATREEARRTAESEFGDYQSVAAACESIRRERTRERRRRGVMDELWQDVRYSIRVLNRGRGFTLVALLTLALGIGATTALFSVVYALLLRPLPFPDDERLLRIGEGNAVTGETGWNTSLPLSAAITSQARTLEAGGSWSGMAARARMDDEPVPVRMAAISAGAFQTLSVQPTLGRLPVAAEQDQPLSSVVLLSEGVWQRWYGGERGVLGRTIEINGTPREIIGVMPKSFVFPSGETELWMPMPRLAQQLHNRSVHIVGYIGKRRSGTNVAGVQAELQSIYQHGQQNEPGSDPEHVIEVSTMRQAMVGDSRSAVLILFAAVSVVLLISCANLAGLQISRVAARRSEVAIRTALGAGRWAVTRQFLMEAIVLGATGCAAAILTARLMLQALLAVYPDGLPLSSEIRIDPQILLFAIAVTLFAVILFGLLPAWQATRTPALGALRSSLARVTHSAAAQRARRVLVVGELALAVLLVVGAALLGRSFVRVYSQPAGFSTDGLLLMSVTPSTTRARETPQLIQFYQALPARVQAIPGVLGVSAASTLPISGGDSHGGLTIDGHAFAPGSEPGTSYRRVLPNYFRTIGIPLRAGREFDDRDRGQEPYVTIINETLARRYFGSPAAAVGRRIKVGPPENEPWLTVVGVVGDVRNEGLEQNDEHASYEPHSQRPWRPMQLVVKTDRDPLEFVPAVRAALRELDPGMLIAEVETMQQRIADSVAARRFNLQMFGAFALLALLLSALGIYGITAQGVAERRRELGVRLALGETPSGILQLVLRQTALLVLAGLCIGMIAALLLNRTAQKLIFEIEATDPISFSLAALVLGVTALIATYIPARRAARTDPAHVIREEN
jgi:putative ABC transport system permease protein